MSGTIFIAARLKHGDKNFFMI